MAMTSDAIIRWFNSKRALSTSRLWFRGIEYRQMSTGRDVRRVASRRAATAAPYQHRVINRYQLLIAKPIAHYLSIHTRAN